MEYDLNDEEEGNSRNGALRDKDSKVGRQEGSLRKPCSNSGKATQRFSSGDFQHTGQERFHSQGGKWFQPECVVKGWVSRLGSSLVSIRKVVDATQEIEKKAGGTGPVPASVDVSL